jgi:copper(I)-binding protein
MRQVDGIDLPAGKRVDLAAGGYHIMLVDLKGQLKEGATVPLTLVLEDKHGKRSTVRVNAEVKPIAYAAPGAP